MCMSSFTPFDFGYTPAQHLLEQNGLDSNTKEVSSNNKKNNTERMQKLIN